MFAHSRTFDTPWRYAFAALTLLLLVASLAAVGLAPAQAHAATGELASCGATECSATPISVHNDSLVISPASLITAESTSAAQSGTCGTNLTWAFSDGVLTVSGSGAMTNYTWSSCAPWADLSVSEVVIKDGVTSIGAYAFYHSKLQTISIPSSVSSLGKSCFDHATNLKSVSLPAAVTSIPENAFYCCPSLQSIDFGGATEFGYLSFVGTWRESFVIPAAVTQIDECAINGHVSYSTKMTKFQVDPANPVYSVKDGVLYTDDGATLFAYPYGKTDTSFTVPSGVTSIGTVAFYRNRYLTTVDLSGVQKLGTRVFSECTKLQDIEFGGAITDLGAYTFESCTALTSIALPDYLSTLDGGVFYDCKNLKSVILPSSLTEIGRAAFCDCTSLVSIEFPATLQFIGGNAFRDCKALTSLTFPSALKEIGACAFKGDAAIPQVVIPYNVTDIGMEAFADTTVVICENPTYKKLYNGSYDTAQEISITGTVNYDYAYKVLELVNEQRAANGCDSLQMDADLLEAAMRRAAETAVYWDHVRPEGSSVYTVSDKASAENIAGGSSTPEAVMNNWMNSSGHRSNILSSRWSSMGVGCFRQGNGAWLWVQLFGEGAAETTAQAANTERSYQMLVTESCYGDTYEYMVQLSSSELKVGQSAQASLYVANPGWSAVKTKIDNSCFTWASSDSSVLSVDTASGECKALKTGTSTLTATLPLNSASAELRVAGSSNNGGTEGTTSISRVAGEEAPQTAVKIAAEAFTSSEWVIIAQSQDFADAMSAAGLAGALDAPILLADPNAGLSADTLDQVKALGASKAYVIGGPGAIKADVATQLKGAGITNITDDGLDGTNSAWRIWGNEAADTSVVCANKIAANGGSTDYAVVAMSDNFQDALSMSSFAYAYKVPIVLETSGVTAADRALPEGAAAVLAGASKQVLVAGGTGALSDASLEGVANTYRLWGDNGFDTSNQIATYLVGQGLLTADTVCVASGASNPKGLDALAGAALAGKNKGVMLLANTRADFDAAGTVSTVTIEGTDSRGTAAFLSTNAASVKSAYVLGGEAVMPAALYDLISGILAVS